MAWILDQTKALGYASIENTLATLTTGCAKSDPLTFIVRLGDLTSSQNFLWTEAGLKTLEHYSRMVGVGRRLSRELVLGTLAADIWSGYTVLNERRRWWPDLVKSQDWQLQHQRSAKRLLDTAALLGGTLIKACQFASTRPDILPATYIQTLSKLQDHVPPLAWSEVAKVIRRELGRGLGDVFERIEP